MNKIPRIVVIGAGIIGSAIAYELSLLNGIEVILVDEKSPASSSTKGALGVLMGVASHKTRGRRWELCKISLKRYKTLIPELERLTQKPISVNYQGILSLHYLDNYLEKWKDLVKIRNFSGYLLETWSKDTLFKKCPHIKDDKVTGAIYSPQDFQINPVEITEALVLGASLNGVNCLFNTKVQKISSPSNHNLSHSLTCYSKTLKQVLTADYIIISAGLGSNKLVNKLETIVKIKPVIGQGIQIDLDTSLGDPNFLPIITGKDVNIIPINPKRYWAGSTVEFPHKHGEMLAHSKFLEQIKRQVFSICPDLKNGNITKTWSGKRPRPDGEIAPIIRKIPHYPNILLATGHYRNGVLLAPATALIIKDKILEDLSMKSNN